ncbi:ParB/RepB/Spo0J family partition protein [Oryzobacter telluris]|uniref:ParB/RepB/Spo0J family partition protein n=1 Tax=Oryzobacter telluris TaxID=3149179 RepID=UPI00370D5097
MSEKRRALGRGLGALIPTAGTATADRPVDVFFRDRDEAPAGDGNGTRDRADTAAPKPAAPGVPAGQEPVAAQPVTAQTIDGEALQPVPGAEFAEIPLDAIRPNSRQPRTVFDEDDMAELVHSIREIGVLQPIVVRPLSTPEDGVRFELIMGERRWRASREAGKDTVPAIIRSTDDDDLLRDALLENLHRSQLNALEEAAAYQQLLDDFGCTQEVLAQRIGRSRPQISNTLRLLKLPPVVARRVAAGVLSAGHARALLGLPDGAAMERLAQRIVAEGLSVRTVEEIVALGDGETPAARKAPRAGARRPQLDDLAADLSDRLETRVRIALGAKKGRLTVEFASVEDLNRILDAMQLRGAKD